MFNLTRDCKETGVQGHVLMFNLTRDCKETGVQGHVLMFNLPRDCKETGVQGHVLMFNMSRDLYPSTLYEYSCSQPSTFPLHSARILMSEDLSREC
jgi:hypothetical protein